MHDLLSVRLVLANRLSRQGPYHPEEETEMSAVCAFKCPIREGPNSWNFIWLIFWVLLRCKSACRGHTISRYSPKYKPKEKILSLSAFVKANVDFICTSCSSDQTDFSCTTTTKHCAYKCWTHPDKILLAISSINDNVTGGMWFVSMIIYNFNLLAKLLFVFSTIFKCFWKSPLLTKAALIWSKIQQKQ